MPFKDILQDFMRATLCNTEKDCNIIKAHFYYVGAFIFLAVILLVLPLVLGSIFYPYCYNQEESRGQEVESKNERDKKLM